MPGAFRLGRFVVDCLVLSPGYLRVEFSQFFPVHSNPAPPARALIAGAIDMHAPSDALRETTFDKLL